LGWAPAIPRNEVGTCRTSATADFQKRSTPLPEVDELRRALEAGAVYSTGPILQELLQGFHKASARKQIIRHFAALPLLVPARDDHVEAAELHNTCRRKGVQIGTIDALLAELCISADARRDSSRGPAP
jgi:predicted nucleic acid-binding protein